MGFTPDVARTLVDISFFAQHGVHVNFAPNSVWLEKEGVDKGIVLRWLAQHMPERFSFKTSIAVADSPMENDSPMTLFSDQGMPFISVEDEQKAKNHSKVFTFSFFSPSPFFLLFFVYLFQIKLKL